MPRGRDDARERGLGEANLPLLGPGHRVARVEMTVNLAARRRRNLEVGADVQLGLWSRHWRRFHDVERHAPFLAELVVQTGLRVVGARIEADATGDVRAQWFSDFPH